MLKIFKFRNEVNESVKPKIVGLENKYKISLPKSYNAFLCQYNGGKTPKTSFKMNKESSDIRAFYGFKEKNINFSFKYLEDNNFLLDFIENGYFPIATDSFGNDIAIGITKANYGLIYFFDSELGIYKLLCDDIIEFFKGIKSQKFHVRTVEERIQGMKEINSPIEINDELIKYWKQEIAEYEGLVQETVNLDLLKEQ